jgi:hypothetical protein
MSFANYTIEAGEPHPEPMPCPQFAEMVRNIDLHRLADYQNNTISNLHLFTRLVWEKALGNHMAACEVCQKETKVDVNSGH